MKYKKRGELDTIIYNNEITISGIPEKAYEYMLNGRTAIAWVMDQYQIKTEKNLELLMIQIYIQMILNIFSTYYYVLLIYQLKQWN